MTIMWQNDVNNVTKWCEIKKHNVNMIVLLNIFTVKTKQVLWTLYSQNCIHKMTLNVAI